MTEKLQKVLARAGVGSRREMEKYIDANRVSVNGKVARLGDRVETTDVIRVDGHVVKIEDKADRICRVLMYNKPEGELCTRKDPEGRRTVFDRLPRVDGERWIAVGRLDINTAGLMLFTNDGELANRLMHPSYEVEREYSARVFGEVTNDTLRTLTKGVELDDIYIVYQGWYRHVYGNNNKCPSRKDVRVNMVKKFGQPKTNKIIWINHLINLAYSEVCIT